MQFLDSAEVARRLTYDACIPLMRAAMIALSNGQTRQQLRTIVPLDSGGVFGVMPGALSANSVFGAKLLSVYPAPSPHQGVIALFDARTGAPTAIVDAREVTIIRTGSASAVATDALARADAERLVIIGTGEQCISHVRAITRVRNLSSVAIWGRDKNKAAQVATMLGLETSVPTYAAPTVEAAVEQADIICTVSRASDPILFGRWVRPGTHVNLVGSSQAASAEADCDLVARAICR